MKPYYDHGGITIYHSRTEYVLPAIATASIDAVITDGPYGIEVDTWDGDVPVDMLGECLRVARGPVCWFGAASRIAIDPALFPRRPERTLIWAPRFTLSHTSQNGMAYRWHPIYAWNIPAKHGGPVWDLLDDMTEGGNWWYHPCTKPVRLMTRLAGFCPPGGTILDPYVGSGTTAVAAQLLGRKCICVEMDEQYCEIIVRRLEQTAMRLDEDRAREDYDQGSLITLP